MSVPERIINHFGKMGIPIEYIRVDIAANARQPEIDALKYQIAELSEAVKDDTITTGGASPISHLAANIEVCPACNGTGGAPDSLEIP